MNITEIKKANKEAGGFWFTTGTLNYFNSTILPKVYEGPGGIYFITSERGPHRPRAYTVRQWHPSYSGIGTVGEFNVLGINEARKLARKAARDVIQPAN